MGNLPVEMIGVLRRFEPACSERVWNWVTVLLVGAILAAGQRTVAAAPRVMGLSTERQFQHYHRVLNRAQWSSREVSRRLPRALLGAFVPPDAPIVVGLDDTIERRRGAKIAAKGIYRDPVRSSKGHFVKASGLRWVSLHLLARIRWAERVWALPLLTVLAPLGAVRPDRRAPVCRPRAGAGGRLHGLPRATRPRLPDRRGRADPGHRHHPRRQARAGLAGPAGARPLPGALVAQVQRPRAQPIERVWGLLKDKVAANRLQGSIEALVEVAEQFVPATRFRALHSQPAPTTAVIAEAA